MHVPLTDCPHRFDERADLLHGVVGKEPRACAPREIGRRMRASESGGRGGERGWERDGRRRTSVAKGSSGTRPQVAHHATGSFTPLGASWHSTRQVLESRGWSDPLGVRMHHTTHTHTSELKPAGGAILGVTMHRGVIAHRPPLLRWVRSTPPPSLTQVHSPGLRCIPVAHHPPSLFAGMCALRAGLEGLPPSGVVSTVPAMLRVWGLGAGSWEKSMALVHHSCGY